MQQLGQQGSNSLIPITAQVARQEPVRERVGLVIAPGEAAVAVGQIVAAEAAGVRQVWMTQTAAAGDTLTLFAAATQRTTHVRMGTAIVPIYPRSPLTMAQQALTLGDLAPNRLLLGVGTSHRPTMENVYGIRLDEPLEHLREYVAVLRAALWDGKVDFQGRFYSIHATLPRTSRTPVLISALREGAFRLAGEISDGAISWMCPVPYLLAKALPALQAGAASRSRPVPPLVAHVPVALSTDRPAVLAAARSQVGRYARLPFYARMFADAGFPIPPDGEMPDALLESLVVSGDGASVAARLRELLGIGLDELLVMLVAVGDAQQEQVQLAGLIGGL